MFNSRHIQNEDPYPCELTIYATIRHEAATKAREHDSMDVARWSADASSHSLGI